MHAPKEEKEHLVVGTIPAGLLPRAGVGSGLGQQGHGISSQ